MSEINANEDPPTPEPPLSTSASSPTEDTNLSTKVMNPDTMDWLNSSPDVKVAKKATEQTHSSEPEAMHDFDNVDGKRQLKS